MLHMAHYNFSKIKTKKKGVKTNMETIFINRINEELKMLYIPTPIENV